MYGALFVIKEDLGVWRLRQEEDQDSVHPNGAEARRSAWTIYLDLLSALQRDEELPAQILLLDDEDDTEVLALITQSEPTTA